MSKIAEKKALEAYPPTPLNVSLVDYNSFKRTFYAKGYDQAMKDFLEKAERYLQNTLYDRVEIEVYGTLIPDIIGKKGFIEQFKNYIENESEN